MADQAKISAEELDLTRGYVCLARAVPIGSPSRLSLLVEARRHYTAHRNAEWLIARGAK